MITFGHFWYIVVYSSGRSTFSQDHSSYLHVFGQWEETGEPVRNPQRTCEDINTSLKLVGFLVDSGNVIVHLRVLIPSFVLEQDA